MPGGPLAGQFPVRTLLDESSTPDSLQLEWGIAAALACRLIRMAVIFQDRSGRDLTIISGARTCAEQMELDARGRPAAPCDLSNHVRCPATAADLYINGGNLAGTNLIKKFGEAAVLAGLRWGGGSPITDGVPSDWQHVDLGPRHG